MHLFSFTKKTSSFQSVRPSAMEKPSTAPAAVNQRVNQAPEWPGATSWDACQVTPKKHKHDFL